MIKFLKNKAPIIFFFFFLLSILPLLLNNNGKGDIEAKKNELFKSELSSLNSVEKVLRYTDSVYSKNNYGNFDTSKYVQIVSNFTKERFYHGLSHYSILDNWIAYLSGKLLWSHLSAIVNPNDILKYPSGLCSQQTIVFMEVLKRKGIRVRSIGLGYKEGPGHFLCEVHYNRSWHLHDVTVEPKWEKMSNHHESLDYYFQNKDSLFLAYKGRIDRNVFDNIMSKVEYGNINEFPAKRMLFFHQVMLALTYIIPLIFLVLFFVSLFRKKTRLNSTPKLSTTNN